MTLAERAVAASARPEVEIRLLGGFEVTLRTAPDGGRARVDVLPEDAWRRRQAAALVKLLALAPARRLHREQVLDALWPGVRVDEAAPRLHKAAHFARRALRDPQGILLRADAVTLCPDRHVTVDVRVFERLAARALGGALGAGHDAERAAAAGAADSYGGSLLPDDLYEPWTAADRDRLRLLYLRLLRFAGRWDRVLAEDPADEEAHLTLMRGYLTRGERHAALRQFDRLERAVARELGVGPSPDALALRAAALTAPTLPTAAATAATAAPSPTAAPPTQATVAQGPATPPPVATTATPTRLATMTVSPRGATVPVPVPVAAEAASAGAARPVPAPATLPASAAGSEVIGRDAELRLVARVLDRVADGGPDGVRAGGVRGAVVLVGGPAGVGKSALLAAVTRRAVAAGWGVGAGTAVAVEGAWPYAPVLEALTDLCRRRPALLVAIDGRYRDELDRATSGRDLDWSGASGAGGQQRLFVAAAELVRAAAESIAGPVDDDDAAAATGRPGVLLVVDDLQDADDASLRLLHYLVRALAAQPVVLLLAHRPVPAGVAAATGEPVLAEIRASLLSRGCAVAVDLRPLDRAATAALVVREAELPEPLVERIWAASGGLPFTALRLARRAALDPGALSSPAATTADLDAAAGDLLRLLAVAGAAFGTDEFVALSRLAEDGAYALLDDLLERGVLDRTDGGYRFRHHLVQQGLLAELPPHRLRVAHRTVAERLAAGGGAPGPIGRHLVLAGERARAVPFVLRAAQTAAALGAFRDALAQLDEIREHAAGSEAVAVAALRADLLVALADPAAADAYRSAIALAAPAEARMPRARLARALLVAGDLAGAADALDGLKPDGGPADMTILLGQGHLAYFRGDVAAAAAIADEAGRRFVSAPTTRFGFDLVSLRGLVAHSRGEYFAQLTADLRHSSQLPVLATTVFDAHLCVAEYMLYGPTPYADVVSVADRLAAAARAAGAARGLAFAACLAGEAQLLGGDLDRAERRLVEAVELHRAIGATAGEAHSLQRLAETRLARGDAAEANRLLLRALPLARWSPIAAHLLHRIHGTLIAAAVDATAVEIALTRVEETLGVEDGCVFCSVTSAVPAVIAAARSGDLARARRHLAAARAAAALWDGTAWQAATHEAEAHVARLEGDVERAGALLVAAGRMFDYVGHPLDAARCYGALTGADAEAGLSQLDDGVVA